MSTVAGNEYAIGYISLGSLNDSVKAVKIDGNEATVDNIKSGTYKISRPFNIVTKDGLSDVAKDFVDYIMSAEGQDIIEQNGYIKIDQNAAAYAGSKPEGKIVVYEVNAGNVGRNADELLRRLHACQFVYEHGDNVCPAKWKLGEKTIQTTIENIGK